MVVTGIALAACGDPEAAEPTSSMTIGDRTVTFEASSIVGPESNLNFTYEGHSPESGTVTEQLSVFASASGDGVSAHDYVCGGPNQLRMMVLDLGSHYMADETIGTCVLTVNDVEHSPNGITVAGVRMDVDVFATVVSETGESLSITGHITALRENSP